MLLAIPFAAGLLLALGTSSASVAPEASSTASDVLPVSGTVVNPCNGENVTWQGTAHFGSGHVNFQGIEGTGSLGNAYRVINTANFELTQSGESAQNEFTTTAAFLFVSQGAAPNFASHTTYHVTFDADGRPTATVTRVETDCRG